MAVKRSLPKNFFLFVVLAFIFWMLAKFSKEYEATVLFKVQYTLPKNKVLQSEPLKEIPIHIKGTGFKLIGAKLFSKEIQLNTNNLVYFEGSKYYILLNQQELGIEKQMSAGLSIDYFVKDSIFFDLGNLATKKIPVMPHAEINFLPGYDFVSKMEIKPDSITITGPNGILDTIHHIKTTMVVIDEVNATIQEKVGLSLPSSTIKIADDTREVSLYGEVDKFTEGIIEVPFSIDNLPEDEQINTFPKTVKVSFNVSLSNFNKVNENSFTVRCDYTFSKENNLSYLIPRLYIQSDLVKNVKMTPTKIDFLIQK
jgi:hypothetical protein